MTREEAIEFIAQSVKSDVDMALVADAIKALEQEPILDKIRAEIESITPKAHIRTGKLSIDTELMIPLVRVLNAIDKYKAESEKVNE